MGYVKQYILRLEESASDEQFGQDAVRYAVESGLVKPTGNIENDKNTVTRQYDIICDAYRTHTLAVDEHHHTQITNLPSPAHEWGAIGDGATEGGEVALRAEDQRVESDGPRPDRDVL